MSGRFTKVLSRARIHQALVRIANRGDPDQTASWVCAVWLGLFDWQPVFKILEHLPDYHKLWISSQPVLLTDYW